MAASKPIKVRVKHRGRRPAELSTPRIAMRNHCLDCCGWQSREVARCSARRCWLWPYRLGIGMGRGPAETVADELPHAGLTVFPKEMLE